MVNRLPRSETLLVLACAAGAALLAGSQFTTMFELVAPGGEAISTVEASDQHGYATLVLAISALVMLVIGIGARKESLAQVAAFAVAACGVVALLIFLVVDLPDANNVGTLDDPRESFIDAKAEPAAGFWFELVGSLLLAVCGGALATLGPESFALRSRGTAESQEPEEADRQPEPESSSNGDPDGGGFKWPSRSSRKS